MRKLLLLINVFILSFVLIGCTDEPITCGYGTSLQGAVCVPSNEAPKQDDEINDEENNSDDFVSLCTMDVTQYEVSKEDYQLVWSDEFEYEGKLDDTKWTYLYGNGHNYGIPGWGNGELQYYTDRLDNVNVQDGILTITASTSGISGYDYTSGRVVTKNHADFTYGIFEVCAKIPTGLGTWPAIWMLPTDNMYGGWPYSGEIDIMEAVGFETDTVHWNIHTKAHNWGDNRSVGDYSTIDNIATEFHRYGIKWIEDKIQFYVDGVHYFTYIPEDLNDSNYWPFNQDFHFLLNIAVGGAWGGQQGIATGEWEASMEVDYVRVYQNSNK